MNSIANVPLNVHGREMTFGEKLKALLSKRRITRVEAAVIVGCSERTIYSWMNGERKPKPLMQEGVLAMISKIGARR